MEHEAAVEWSSEANPHHKMLRSVEGSVYPLIRRNAFQKHYVPRDDVSWRALGLLVPPEYHAAGTTIPRLGFQLPWPDALSSEKASDC